MLKWLLLLLYLASIVYVHVRGRVRHAWLQQVFDHSALLAPLNVLMYAFSRVPNHAYVSVDHFQGLRTLESQWQVIRDEGLALARQRAIKASERYDDAGFNSFFKEGWTRFYLKWYEVEPASAARLCPRTVALLRDVPGLRSALFAELPPGAKLNAHRDPYAGSLRFHLGLATPNDDRCRIWVDDEPYSWRDGEGVVFDETFIHWVRNDTDATRLILMCDIERPMRSPLAQSLNRWFSRRVMSAAAAPNEAGDAVGLISRLFRLSYVAGQYRRRFKHWNPALYQATRMGLLGGLVLLIVWI